ncbi:MAG: hypothetical protein H6696_16660 [Deferribacteres bacterium]|nr:hypothetical protein [candidate division KSB1 bacterium]MCB9503566.1 hypothetical protein [Deferribacteres bacterium]
MTMKVIKYLLPILLICFFMACEISTEPEIYDVDATIKTSEIYEYHTGISGDEEGAAIKTQAKNFEISEILRNASTNFEAVYRYKSNTGFVGLEYVELELKTGSDGASPPKNIKNIKIALQVTK